MTHGNTGHGHVWPRPDGMKARCGGPGLCPECSRVKAVKDRETAVAAPQVAMVQRDSPVDPELREQMNEASSLLPYAFITCNSNSPDYFVTIKTKTLKDAHQWHDAVLGLARTGR